MSLWLIYILVMIPTIKGMIGEGLTPVGIGLGIVAVALSFITFGRSLIGYLNDAKTNEEKAAAAAENAVRVSRAWKYFRGISYVYAFLAVFFVLLPSERQMYVMAGAYAVTNIEGIKNLPENAVGAANAWLKRLGDAAAADGDAAVASQLSTATSALPAAPVK